MRHKRSIVEKIKFSSNHSNQKENSICRFLLFSAVLIVIPFEFESVNPLIARADQGNPKLLAQNGVQAKKQRYESLKIEFETKMRLFNKLRKLPYVVGPATMEGKEDVDHFFLNPEKCDEALNKIDRAMFPITKQGEYDNLIQLYEAALREANSDIDDMKNQKSKYLAARQELKEAIPNALESLSAELERLSGPKMFEPLMGSPEAASRRHRDITPVQIIDSGQNSKPLAHEAK